MPNTYYLIESATVGSGGSSSVAFTSIPQTYTDLKVVTSLRSTTGGAVTYSLFMKMNNLTSSIYSQKALEGNGATTTSFSQSGVDTAVRSSVVNGAGATASTFSNSEIYIPNYTGSTKKSASIDSVSETNATTVYLNLIAYLIDSTDAITDLTFTTEPAGGVAFAEHSTFYLYGIIKS
jgi:hypothetical protein